MPRKYRLDDLRLRCQRRANKENDPSIGNPEWNMMISEQYGDLFSEVEKTGMRHFESTFAIAATGAASYTVPDDFLATLGVFRITDALGSVQELDEIMFQERVRWAGQVGDARAYAVVGTSIFLFPKPSTGSYELVYQPQAPDLSTAADSTLVDLVQADGEGFLIWGVAAMAKDKSEADMRYAEKKSEAARERFVSWCTMKAFTQQRRPIIRTSLNEAYNAGDFTDAPGTWAETPPR